MDEREKASRGLWSFPEGMLGPDDRVKGFRVEASDGHAGKVSWASYAPGEGYLVISLIHRLHGAHHVVPAGAAERISAEDCTVWLRLSLEELPEHRDQPASLETWMVDAINRATATRGLGGDMF